MLSQFVEWHLVRSMPRIAVNVDVRQRSTSTFHVMSIASYMDHVTAPLNGTCDSVMEWMSSRIMSVSEGTPRRIDVANLNSDYSLAVYTIMLMREYSQWGQRIKILTASCLFRYGLFRGLIIRVRDEGKGRFLRRFLE